MVEKLWKAYGNICSYTPTIMIFCRRVVVFNVADSMIIMLLILAAISLADPLFALASEYPDWSMMLPAIYLLELFLIWLFCIVGDAADIIDRMLFDRD